MTSNIIRILSLKEDLEILEKKTNEVKKMLIKERSDLAKFINKEHPEIEKIQGKEIILAEIKVGEQNLIVHLEFKYEDGEFQTDATKKIIRIKN